MKILHVTPSFYPAFRYGGPIQSTYDLCAFLTRQGQTVRVLTTDADGRSKTLPGPKNVDVTTPDAFTVCYCRRRTHDDIAPGMLARLPHYVRWADVVHLTGVYSFPTIPTLVATRALGKSLVWSPRGALQRAVRTKSGLAKRPWEFICRLLAPHNVVLHTTSVKEAQESADLFPSLRSVVIPNGVSVPPPRDPTLPGACLHLLYLGRLHPLKGLDNLLDSCGLLKRATELQFTLAIAGEGDATYEAHLRNKAKALGLHDRVAFLGLCVGDSKRALLSTADVLLVPSLTESFGLSVIEALAHSVPVIASEHTPWRSLEQVGCGLFVPNSPSHLANAIERIASMPLRHMGERGRHWVETEYSWEHIANTMVNCYADLTR